ncbi:MAG: hypothetical protein ONB37_03415 [candidate division KSB1 bacterium]|nr:hypothetical protein [candidate division KSB1 bacterium]
MREILEQANLALLAEIDLLIAALPDKSSIAPELATYYDQIEASCQCLRQKVRQSLKDLSRGKDNILVDILSNTQTHTREFHLYNYRLVTPLRRYRESDLLCLKLIHWLHQMHPKTRMIPGAFCDGDIGIYPSIGYPITYFMPTSAQYGLLYLPLFFHEFGHLLYACHEPEMNQLVFDLQNEIDSIIKQEMVNQGAKGPKNAQKRKVIVQTWFTWTQELFCDAVGFQIGGLSYIYAFSMYLKMWGIDRFHLPIERLTTSTHPLTWFRIKFLAEFLQAAGNEKVAEWLTAEWQAIADALAVNEDYFGFYQDDFKPPIMETLRSMLEEAAPLLYSQHEFDAYQPCPSPIDVLNWAWQKFYEDPNGYPQWEKQAVSTFLSTFDAVYHPTAAK